MAAGDAGPVDWVTLTPGGGLEDGAACTGRSRLGGDRAPEGGSTLSYADLAVAVLDEIERPTRDRTRVSVIGDDGDRIG